MRPLILAAALAAAPVSAAAQVAPRCLALELGFARDSWEKLGDRMPVALAAAWWLAGDLDATARVGWSFATQTRGRAAVDSFEAGAGLRLGFASSRTLRPFVVADVSVVQLLGGAEWGPWATDSGVRVGAGAALEIFFARDLSVSVTARVTELALASGSGGPGGAVSLAGAVYF